MIWLLCLASWKLCLCAAVIQYSTRTEAGENLSGQWLFDFIVSWDGFLDSSRWIDPDGV
jgi:hypothetical protein